MQLKEMEKQVVKIKKQLQKIEVMRPGSINKQFTVCGKPGCACVDPKEPKKHGPYYQLSYVHKGKSTSQFIHKELVQTVEHQLKNFKMFKSLTAEWVDLSITIAREKLAADKLRIKNEAARGED